MNVLDCENVHDIEMREEVFTEDEDQMIPEVDEMNNQDTSVEVVAVDEEMEDLVEVQYFI